MPITISGSTGISGVDGSASTPAVRGTDTNTGIAFPAADTVAVATGGSERMRVDSSGNVGIGTSTPSYKLEVRATAGGVGAVVAGANAGGNAQINVNSTFSSTSPVYGFFFNGTTGIGNPASNVISAITAGTETMRIDSSGNVGIGNSAPGERLVIQGSTTNVIAQIRNSSTVNSTSKTSAVQFIGTDTVGSAKETGNIYVTPADNNYVGSNMLFYTRGSDAVAERARITSGGEFLVGVTSGNAIAGSVGALGYQARSGRTGSFAGNLFNINWTGSAQLWIDTTNVGTITLTSDYRIKRNIETQDQPALDRVLQLRPVTYQMADYGDLIEASDDIREGFIAHELAAVIPSAVSGEKDAPDQLQSLKIDALCSVLVKAIQELKAENDDLKARLTALEAK